MRGARRRCGAGGEGVTRGEGGFGEGVRMGVGSFFPDSPSSPYRLPIRIPVPCKYHAHAGDFPFSPPPSPE